MVKRISAIFGYINRHPLAGKRKWRSYFNFFKWQFRSRLFPGPHRIPFVGKTVLMVKNGMAGATGNIYLGLHDFSEMSFLLHFLKPGDHFMDVGANVGSYTVLAAGVAGANCAAFEPVPGTFESLERNISANSLQSSVKCINSGVGSAQGMLYFTSENDSVNHFVPEELITDFNKVVKVPMVILDDYAPEVKGAILIKIDVEGFETEVLKGMPGLLQNQSLRGIIIELNGSGNRYGYDESAIHALLLKNGFEPYEYEPFSRTLKKQDSFGKFNTIYLRDIDYVKDRIRSAAHIKVFSEVF